MSFCRNCGNQIPAGAGFCNQCGTKVAEDVQQINYAQGTTTPQYAPNPYANINANGNMNGNMAVNTAPKGKNIIIIAIIVVAAILAVMQLYKTFGVGSDYERPIKQLLKSVETGSFDTFKSAFPDFLEDEIDGMLYEYVDEDDYMDSMLEDLEYSYGDGIKMSYKILDKEKMDSRDLIDMEDRIESYYDEKVNVKAGYTLNVRMKVKGSEDSDQDEIELDVIKIGSKWYLMDSNIF